MRLVIGAISVLTLSVLFLIIISTLLSNYLSPPGRWQIKSVDTVKFSRDLAREKLHDPAFAEVVDSQVRAIASLNPTHIAISTPYDDEFLPFLRLWVASARKYHLKVWFRGNFSGWEGWFNYPKISRDDHKKLLNAFITSNSDLFEDGDIFTSCTECENGGPGDPRNVDLIGFRNFLISEKNLSDSAFNKINKKVMTDLYPMNGEVAAVVMDPETTSRLGGIVTIDHYVNSPSKLRSDIEHLSSASRGLVMLGEFGLPVPEINGNMTASQQSENLDNFLSSIFGMPRLTGINYWVNSGGSTALWNNDGSPRPAIEVLKKYFNLIP
ncbi:MAG TPA: hypothetical protein VF828_04370 [Patescibacteria group bacterium]